MDRKILKEIAGGFPIHGIKTEKLSDSVLDSQANMDSDCFSGYDYYSYDNYAVQNGKVFDLDKKGKTIREMICELRLKPDYIVNVATLSHEKGEWGIPEPVDLEIIVYENPKTEI